MPNNLLEPKWFTDESSREKQVLKLASEGLTDQQVALNLGISIHTVGTYWARIFSASGAHSRTHAVALSLKAQADSFRRVVEFSMDSIWILDGEFVVYANEAAASLLGVSLSDLIGGGIFRFLPAPDKATVEARMKNAASGNANQCAKVTAIRPDGEEVHFEGISGPILWEGQSLIMISARDRTELHRAEQLIAEERSRLETILEGFQDSVYRLTRDGIFIEYRAGLARLSDPDPRDPVGKHYSEFGCSALNSSMDAAFPKLTPENRTQIINYSPTTGERLHSRECRLTLLRDGTILAVVRPFREIESSHLC